MPRMDTLAVVVSLLLGLAVGCVSEIPLQGAQCSGTGEFCGSTTLLCKEGTCQKITGPIISIDECSDDSNCSEVAPYCRPYSFDAGVEVKLCVECVGDQHCAQPTPVCASGVLSVLPKCLGCFSDSQCDSYLCSPDYQCIPCTANLASCNGGRICDEATGQCIEAGNNTVGDGEE